MITIIMKGDVLLHVAVADIPEEYLFPIMDKDPACEHVMYRHTHAFGYEDRVWQICTRKHGLNWRVIDESEVPATARLASTIGG